MPRSDQPHRADPPDPVVLPPTGDTAAGDVHRDDDSDDGDGPPARCEAI